MERKLLKELGVSFGNNKEKRQSFCAGDFLSNAVEVIDFIGVQGGIRTLVGAVKAMCPDVSY